LLLKDISKLKAKQDEKNECILEYESKTIELIDKNKELQEMLDESRKIYKSIKEELREIKRLK